MKPYTLLLAALLLLGMAPQACHAYGDPFVLGQGRYLTFSEQQSFYQHVQQTGSESEKEKYANAFERLRSSSQRTPIKIEIIEFTRFSFKSVMNQGATPGSRIFLICFECEEGIPANALAARKKTHSRYYDIWVLSAEFMVVEQDPETGGWRVLLENGGAE